MGIDVGEIAYCVVALEQRAAADRALLAASGTDAALREAATESLQLHERSIGKLRASLAAISGENRRATDAAAREAQEDASQFSRHFEVCWNYCSSEDVRSPQWQACIARCRSADPVISKLDRCRQP